MAKKIFVVVESTKKLIKRVLLSVFFRNKALNKNKIVNSVINGNVSIDDGCKIINSRLFGFSSLEIGKHTSIMDNVEITAYINNIKIGKYCSIARNTTILEYYHDPERMTTYFINKNLANGDMKNEIKSKGDIIIKNDVWIGTNATILSGVTIGNGAIIGANSVVTKDVPDYAVVGGVPARIIKYRFDQEVISELINLEWWNMDEEEIKMLLPLFSRLVTLDLIKDFKNQISNK